MSRLEVCPGDGLLARRGDVVVVVATSGGQGLDRILGLLGTLSGEALLEALGAAIADLGEDAPPIAAAMLAGDRRAFLAHAGGVVVAHAGGSDHLGALEPGERLGALPRSAERIRLSIGEAGSPRVGTDLVEGVVVGAGAEAAVTPLGPPPAPPPAPPSLDVVSLAPDAAPAESLAGLEPLPVGAPTADSGPEAESEGAGDEDGAVLVPGVRCPRDHHNSPEARFCHRCGIRMGAHRSLIIVTGPRPPLGVLVLDDGGTFAVVGDAIIGREPTADATVQQGEAEPLTIEDPERLASRAHARITLDGWDVFLEDRASANGTWVRMDEESWRRLAPNEQLALQSGMRLKIGGREILFEHHHQ